MMLGDQNLKLSAGPGLVGREALVATLEAQLSSTRLLTLTGPGGVGKTRVAQALGGGREVIWVELAPLAGEAFVLPAVAAACGVVEQRGPLLSALAEAL